MIRIFITLVMAGFCCCSLAAQDTASDVSSVRFRQQYDFFSKQLITQPLLPLPAYARVEAGFRFDKGEYILAQDAPKQQEIFFYTEGSRRVKKYQLSGSFSYRRTQRDSAAFSLRPDFNDPSPFYFYAAKKGNWEMGRYDLQGIISRQYLNDQLTVGLGLHYNAGNAWRSNDPRPDFFDHTMNGGVTVHYKLNAKHSAGLSAELIRKSNETKVIYRNDDYSYNLQYQEYITYIQYGYGFSEPWTTDRSIVGSTHGLTGQGFYQVKATDWSFTFKGGYTSQESKSFRRGTATSVPVTYGWFNEEILNAGLFVEYGKTGTHRFSLDAGYLHHKGKDRSVKLNGNNYVYTQDQLSVQPLYQQYKENRLQYELGLKGTLTGLYRADGSTAIAADYRYAGLNLTGAWYWKAGQGQLKTLLGAGWQHPLDARVTQPAQQSSFIRGVVFRDAYFYNADNVSGTLDLMYSLKVKKTKAFIDLRAQYLHANIKELAIPAASKPGSNRWWWQAGIGLFL